MNETHFGHKNVGELVGLFIISEDAIEEKVKHIYSINA